MDIYEAKDQEIFEKNIREEICLVLSETEFRHMTLQRFRDTVVYNLQRGVRYRYIIPSSIPFQQYFQEFKNLVAIEADIDRSLFQSVTLDSLAFGIVTPLVLFDPSLPTGHGYLRHFTGNNYMWLRLQSDRLPPTSR